MNKNAPDNIVQLQTACDRVAHHVLARQAPRDSELDRQSNTYGGLLEQLEAETDSFEPRRWIWYFRFAHCAMVS
jgi:hypothetical protein